MKKASTKKFRERFLPPGWIFRLAVCNTNTLTSTDTEYQVRERRLVSFICFYLHDESKKYIHIYDYKITRFYSRVWVQIPTHVLLCRRVSNI
jgi:hypothetical protein